MPRDYYHNIVLFDYNSPITQSHFVDPTNHVIKGFYCITAPGIYWYTCTKTDQISLLLESTDTPRLARYLCSWNLLIHRDWPGISAPGIYWYTKTGQVSLLLESTDTPRLARYLCSWNLLIHRGWPGISVPRIYWYTETGQVSLLMESTDTPRLARYLCS